MNIRLKRDKFLCWLFGHKWLYKPDEEPMLDIAGWALFVCLRCAGTKWVNQPQPLIPNDDFTVSSIPPAWLGKQKGENDENQN